MKNFGGEFWRKDALGKTMWCRCVDNRK